MLPDSLWPLIGIPLLKVLDTVRAAHPTAFISVQDVRSVQEGFFPKR